MVNFDDDFSVLLSNAGHLVPFFDSFFGFLYRRTDFFVVKCSESEKVGFCDGVNEKVLIGAFNRWKNFAKNELENARRLQNSEVPLVAEEVEVVDTEASYVEEIPNVTDCTNDDPVNLKSSTHQDEAETFNGADLKTYRWSQTQSDLDVTVPVDPGILKGNQLKVDVKSNTIRVTRKDTNDVLLEGNFFAPVKPQETIWNLLPGQKVELSLEKLTDGWWTKLLTSEDHHIEASSLKIEQHVEEMSSVDKMAIEEAMVRQTKKSSEKGHLEEILKSAWNQEGSPFVGQPYDPTVLQNIQS